MKIKARVSLTFAVAALVGTCFGAMFAGALAFVAHSKHGSSVMEAAQTPASVYTPASAFSKPQ
jgi:ABC-type phosphate/phosphonate transport system permease subunit